MVVIREIVATTQFNAISAVICTMYMGIDREIL